ncbi:MAG: hypothetical protein O3A63_15885, partial [Proteobacteria bacterium]|nr:hypothetical protein [Pseudomonadota bacterium]
MRLLLACLLLLTLSAVSQTADSDWQVPRTPSGRPDLQGVWANNSATPLERPDALAGREKLTPDEINTLR